MHWGKVHVPLDESQVPMHAQTCEQYCNNLRLAGWLSGLQ